MPFRRDVDGEIRGLDLIGDLPNRLRKAVNREAWSRGLRRYTLERVLTLSSRYDVRVPLVAGSELLRREDALALLLFVLVAPLPALASLRDDRVDADRRRGGHLRIEFRRLLTLNSDVWRTLRD
jgi:hypothetical protein